MIGPRRVSAAPETIRGVVHPDQRATGVAFRNALLAAYSYAQDAGRFGASFSAAIVATGAGLFDLSSDVVCFRQDLYIPAECVRVRAHAAVTLPPEESGALGLEVEIDGTSGSVSERAIESDAADYPPETVSVGSGGGIYLLSATAEPGAAADSRVTVRALASSSTISALGVISSVVTFEFV